MGHVFVGQGACISRTSQVTAAMRRSGKMRRSGTTTAWASNTQRSQRAFKTRVLSQLIPWSCKGKLKLFIHRSKDGTRAPARMDTATVEARVDIPDVMKECGYAIHAPFSPALARADLQEMTGTRSVATMTMTTTTTTRSWHVQPSSLTPDWTRTGLQSSERLQLSSSKVIRSYQAKVINILVHVGVYVCTSACINERMVLVLVLVLPSILYCILNCMLCCMSCCILYGILCGMLYCVLHSLCIVVWYCFCVVSYCISLYGMVWYGMA